MNGQRTTSKCLTENGDSCAQHASQELTPRSIIHHAEMSRSQEIPSVQKNAPVRDKPKLPIEQSRGLQEQQNRNEGQSGPLQLQGQEKRGQTDAPPSSNMSVATKYSMDDINEYMDQKFRCFVSIIQNASDDFLVKRFSIADLEAKKIGDLFETARKDALYSRVNTVDEVILFAAADMFRSPSNHSHWFGAKLASAILSHGNIRVHYTLTRLILHGMQSENNSRLLLDLGSIHVFLNGLTAVLNEVLWMVALKYDAREEMQRWILYEDKSDMTEERRQRLDNVYQKFAKVETNLIMVTKMLRAFCGSEWMIKCMNSNVGLLDVIASLMRHPKVEVSTITELMRFAAKNKMLLSALDRKDPFGCVPEVMLNIAGYCVLNRVPEWNVPRFLGDKNLSEDETNILKALVIEGMCAYAENVRIESIFFERFCDFVKTLFVLETASEIPSGNFTEMFKRLSERFPNIIHYAKIFLD